MAVRLEFLGIISCRCLGGISQEIFKLSPEDAYTCYRASIWTGLCPDWAAALIERFLASKALIQPVNAPSVVRHACNLLLPRGATPSLAAAAFAEWVKTSFPKTRLMAEGAIET
ncbi:hypothetical protein [Sinorhizobium meliloti]|uniref:hypothetical protein n=1 Tax=Rhizobium meliloti TaxID=382 RepID=UPI003F135C1B